MGITLNAVEAVAVALTVRIEPHRGRSDHECIFTELSCDVCVIPCLEKATENAPQSTGLISFGSPSHLLAFYRHYSDTELLG